VRFGATTLSNRFGTHDVQVGAPDELCVAVLFDPSPDADFRLEITPRELTIFKPTEVSAIAYFDDGHTENVSKKAGWSAADGTVVDITDPLDGWPGVGTGVVPLGPGKTTVSATYNGVSSSDTGGDAIVTVTWPIERLEILPPAVNRVAAGPRTISSTATSRAGIAATSPDRSCTRRAIRPSRRSRTCRRRGVASRRWRRASR
jgi:hypothetical protein